MRDRKKAKAGRQDRRVKWARAVLEKRGYSGRLAVKAVRGGSK